MTQTNWILLIGLVYVFGGLVHSFWIDIDSDYKLTLNKVVFWPVFFALLAVREIRKLSNEIADYALEKDDYELKIVEDEDEDTS